MVAEVASREAFDVLRNDSQLGQSWIVEAVAKSSASDHTTSNRNPKGLE